MKFLLGKALLAATLLLLVGVQAQSGTTPDRAYGANRDIEGPGAPLTSAGGLTNEANFPFLLDVKMSHGNYSLESCAIQTLHWHNCDEITYILSGEGVAATSMDNGTLVMFKFHTGDAMVFPRGTVHWIFNSGTEQARFFSSYNNQHPTYQPVHLMVNPFPSIFSAFAFNITEDLAKQVFQKENSPDSTLVPGCPDIDYTDWNLLNGYTTGYLFPMASTQPVGNVGYMGFVGGGTLQGDFYSYSSNRPIDAQLGTSDGAGPWGSFAPLTFGKPGNTDEEKYAASAEIMNGLEMNFGIIAFETCGASVPHRHRNADEMYYVLGGQGIVGHIAQNGSLFMYQVQEGDVGIFPRGTVHLLYNFDENKNLTFMSTWNNQKFASQFLPWTFSVVSEQYQNIPTPILQQAFGITAEQVELALRGGDSTVSSAGKKNPVLTGTPGVPGCPKPQDPKIQDYLIDGQASGYMFRTRLPPPGSNGYAAATAVGIFSTLENS